MECASGLAEEDAKEGSMHGLYRPGRIAMRTAMAAAGYKAIGTVAKKAGMKQATLYKRVRIPTTALVSELRAIDAVTPFTPEQALTIIRGMEIKTNEQYQLQKRS